jgi:3-dehydrosphinganine reductase
MRIKNFQGRTVYITGGSSGIGLSIAKALSARGAHIVLFARNRDRLETALREVSGFKASDAQRLACQPLDVSEYPDVERVMEMAVKTNGVPDLLINCAGRSLPNYFEDIPFEQFDEIIKVNLYGTWNTCSVLVPFMKKQGAGQIVNVSSVAGVMAIFGFTDYGASKAAVIALSRILKSELKPYGIGVSVLLPTDTDTPGYYEESKTRPIETKVICGWSKVVDPDLIARGLLKGLKKGQFIIIPTLLDRFFCFVDRLLPRFLDFMTDMDVRKAQRKKGAT